MKEKIIGVIGLGYVGLPLALEFSKKYYTIGFDININRIQELKNSIDSTLETNTQDLESSVNNGKLKVTNNIKDLKDCNYYIISVPTPIHKNNQPNLDPLIKATKDVSSVLKKKDIVIYESTVYPGLTESVCVPLLQKESGLFFNKDFFVGYSPERINPGDKKHTLVNIVKITSGSNDDTADKVDQLYASILNVPTFKTSSIKIAEAAKVIENTQRDINIAFVNELAKIFHLLEIDTNEVLDAANTKWNFLNFRPGLVGGHCIGVDPYYLSNKAEELGYFPEMILAGRRINSEMGKYISSRVIKLMVKNKINPITASVLVLGFTFKENCPDIRNTRVIDIVNDLKEYINHIEVVDPHAKKDEVKRIYDIDSNINIPNKKYDLIILAVSHKEFLIIDLKKYLNKNGLIFDVKGSLDKNIVNGRL